MKRPSRIRTSVPRGEQDVPVFNGGPDSPNPVSPERRNTARLVGMGLAAALIERRQYCSPLDGEPLT